MPPVCYDAARKEHRPYVEGEVIKPETIPVSSFPGNELFSTPSGLYVGKFTLPPTIKVDPANGVDNYVLHQSSAITVKSLDFALYLVETHRPRQAAILLLPGTPHSLRKIYTLRDVSLTIGFYGEPAFDTIDNYNGNGKLASQFVASLVRPVVIADVVQDQATSLWTCGCLHMVNSTLRLVGLHLSIPARPSAEALQQSAYSVFSDLVRLEGSTLSLQGAYVNKLSPDSCFGLVGVASQTRGRIRSYASVFAVENAILASTSANSIALANRVFFIKLLPDEPSGDQRTQHYSLISTSVGPTPSSAMLEIFWTLTKSLLDSNNQTIQASFPDGSAAYGIGNYIFGIVRDAQRRPINVSCNLPI